MQRIVLEDGSWFDADQATQWDDPRPGLTPHTLYRTAKGQYILGGQNTTFHKLPDHDAYNWLLKCGFGDAVPPEILAAKEI